MLIFQPLVVSTPLLKIPLLVAYATSMYTAWTPPKTKALPEMVQSDVTQTDFITRSMRVQVALATPCKVRLISPRSPTPRSSTSHYLLCGLAVVEACLLVSYHAPQNFVSDNIIALFGRGLTASSLQPSPISFVGLACATFGAQIRIWCHQALGKYFTWKVSVHDDHKLITDGPYAIVRHPSYLGWLLVAAGNLTYLFDPASYFAASGFAGTTAGRATATFVVLQAVQLTVGLLGRMDQEDRKLKETFGDQWRAYAAHVPYSVVPFVY
ncbi:ICMT-domain-containing protein [Epithele typhae]|uniref:ICMT-domain-containing protein n=1 Tax=Epithele typhae TaxID=378194 RepID=UPI0020074C68|nr:ICMT-domain-containing protein [Epithele typhae]KAH9930451.1 ICMT-domain-containing protein [Epithele typhae]